MPDPLDPVLPPGTRARTEAEEFLELRARYRAEARKALQRRLRGTELKGLRTDAPAGQIFRSMEEFLAQGGEVPDPEAATFETLPVPQAKLDDLAGNAEGVLRGEQVRHAGNPTGDASREGPDLASLDEQSVLDWTERNITAIRGPGELHPHLGDQHAQESSSSKRESGTADPAPGTNAEGEVPSGDQPQDGIAGAGERPPWELNPKYIVTEGSAQDSAAFRKFWEDFRRKGSAPSLPSCGAIPPGSTVAIPNEVAFQSGSRIWFAGRGPFRSIPGTPIAADAPDPVPAPAQWWRVFAQAVRRFLQLCWDCCHSAITRRRSGK